MPVSGLKLICDKFDESLGIHKKSTRHTKRNAEKDERDMIKEISNMNPFQYYPGRQHATFPDIKRSPLLYLNFNEFETWIMRRKAGIAALR